MRGYVRRRYVWQIVFLTTILLAGVWGVSLILHQNVILKAGLPPVAPKLSKESGFYEKSFDLVIAAEKGTDIYYTLDGSEPNVNSIHYEEPILITGESGAEKTKINAPYSAADEAYEERSARDNMATVLRVVAIDGMGKTSDIVTATYFVGASEQENKIALSIVTDSENLFGDYGIYVSGAVYDAWYQDGMNGDELSPNYMQRGKGWERPVFLEFFMDGTEFFQQPAGIRIQGSSTRVFRDKRFSIYARKEYSGSGWFEEPLFGEEKCHSFFFHPGFMNSYIQHLIQDRDVASAESFQLDVYINGVFWYTTMAQEKYSEKYFQEHYGVDDGNVVIVKAGAAESGNQEDQQLYQQIYDFLETHDMTREESYRQLDGIMDIQSYIDFICANVYFANMDYSEDKNIICWRAREKEVGEYGDGRWRWAFYDMDLLNTNCGCNVEDINTFTQKSEYVESVLNERPMYAALRRNPVFCRQFVLSFMDMINTDFTVERGMSALESWGGYHGRNRRSIPSGCKTFSRPEQSQLRDIWRRSLTLRVHRRQ